MSHGYLAKCTCSIAVGWLLVPLAFSQSHPDTALTLTSPLDLQVVQQTSLREGIVPIAGGLAVDVNSRVRIEARVFRGAINSNWKNIAANLHEREFTGSLTLPAGGWYQLEVRAVDETGNPVGTATIERVGVGEVFVVAGQSNSANHGEEKQTPQSDRVVNFDGTQWHLATDPQPGASGRGGSFVPPLGDALAEQYDVPIGFITCGIGATSVREWLPKDSIFPNPPTIESRVERLSDGQWASNGEAFAMFVTRLKSLGPNGFRAVLWHQGESDANQKDPTRTLSGKLYRDYLEQIIRQSRREIGWEIPWLVAQVSYHAPGDEASPDIREAQASLWRDGIALEGPDSDALKDELRQANGKGVHFSGEGLRQHAAKWAEKICPWLDVQMQHTTSGNGAK